MAIVGSRRSNVDSIAMVHGYRMQEDFFVLWHVKFQQLLRKQFSHSVSVLKFWSRTIPYMTRPTRTSPRRQQYQQQTAAVIVIVGRYILIGIQHWTLSSAVHIFSNNASLNCSGTLAGILQ